MFYSLPYTVKTIHGITSYIGPKLHYVVHYVYFYCKIMSSHLFSITFIKVFYVIWLMFMALF